MKFCNPYNKILFEYAHVYVYKFLDNSIISHLTMHCALFLKHCKIKAAQEFGVCKQYIYVRSTYSKIVVPHKFIALLREIKFSLMR